MGYDANTGTTGLDFVTLISELILDKEPLARLAVLVHDIEDRLAAADANKPVCGREKFIARRLREAGLMEGDLELPAVTCVQIRTTGLIYLRMTDISVPYLAKLRILAIEGAVNESILATALEGAEPLADEDEVAREAELVARSVALQARTLGPVCTPGEGTGEWACRRAMAFGIEAFQLPFRLQSSFRANISAHAMAIEVALLPADVLPRSSWVEGAGVVAASVPMRAAKTTDYDLRLVLLAAGYALEAAPGIDEVWVAGTLDTPASHECLVWARLTREQMAGVDLGPSSDPVALLASLGATFSVSDGALCSVRQGFSLEDELFCPARRYERPELSSRELTAAAARALGSAVVCDLGVDEAAERRVMAERAERGVTSSTQQNVRLLMGLAEDASSQTAKDAARRVAGELIEGTLEDDPEAVAAALVDGGALSSSLERGIASLHDGDPSGAYQTISVALLAARSDGAYEDDENVRWRAFNNYTDRVVYNRLLAEPGVSVALVPPQIFHAELFCSQAAMLAGMNQEALSHAAMAQRIAPLSTEAAFQLSACLSVAGEKDSAEQVISKFLSCACEAESIGLGYLRMASIQWDAGKVEVARACLALARQRFGGPLLEAGIQALSLIGKGSLDPADMPLQRAREIIIGAGVPLAPTTAVEEVLQEAARAAVDQELFPIAKNLMTTIGALTRDDVSFGILRSIEDAPDR